MKLEKSKYRAERDWVNPVISQGFNAVVITQVSTVSYERMDASVEFQTVLGEKFWPAARPQVEKARRRI
jgi:hypothetical protein